ncbi:MAG TPA: hypothetical protein VF824_03830 [Thermoanaerobaculia bacterium]|jgi:hypothetical protein
MDEEIREYIDAYRASSDRARISLYVVVVVTVLVFIANHNIMENSWPRVRLDTWYSKADAAQRLPNWVTDGAAMKQWFERFKDRREEYLKHFVDHVLFTSSPIPGVVIDVHDLGLIGGLALSVTLALFLVCLMREHENLYLALYKVRRLCDEKSGKERSDRAGNFLYHALAMRQVLVAAPTLARWSHPIGAVRHAVFYAPSLVHAWVVWSNQRTIEAGATYLRINLKLVMFEQYALTAVLFILSTFAALQSRAIAARWRKAFFRINPGREYADQMSVRKWLKLELRDDHASDEAIACGSVRAHLVDTIEVGDGFGRDQVGVHRVRPIGGRIRATDVEEMLKALRAEGTAAAKRWCDARGKRYRDLCEFTKSSNILVPRTSWTISGTWTFRYEEGRPR